MADDDYQIFRIRDKTTGHVLTFRAKDEESAMAGAQQWHDQNSSVMGNIRDIPGSFGYGLTKGFSDYASNLAQATTHEMSQPEMAATIPSGEEAFKGIQEHITGPISPPTTPLGEVAAKTGQMLSLNPMAALTPGASMIGSGASALTSELAKSYAKGTPYETAAEIVGGGVGPTLMGLGAKAFTGLAKLPSAMFGGVSPSQLSEAYASGTLGGKSTEAQMFSKNIGGKVPQEDVIPYAEKGLSNLKRSQSENYDSDMMRIEKNYGSTKLSFDPIDSSIARSQAYSTRYGQPLDLHTQPVRDEAQRIVNEWRTNAAADPRLQTPYGMDGLKRKVWNEVVAPLPEDTPQRAAAMTIYHGVKKAITDQAPEYKNVMQHYEDSEHTINNIERTLSLSRGATDDTTLRKLQSSLNDNVNTNFGQRAKLVDALEENGAPGLKAALAGQQLRSLGPKGAAKWADPIVLATLFGQAAVGSPHAAGVLATVPFMSPRLAGNVAHYAGRTSGYLGLPEMLQRAQSPSQIFQNTQALMAKKLMEGQQ